MPTIIRRQFLFFAAIVFGASLQLFAQNVAFTNISTAQGLSDNFIRSIAVDKKGFLWVGTNEGINSYDGYSVTNYSPGEYPQIPHKIVKYLDCDKDDNLWMGTAEGAAWADAARAFHRVVLPGSVTFFNCPWICQTMRYGPVLFTDKGTFVSDDKYKHWQRLDWLPACLRFGGLHEIMNYDENRLLIATDSLVLVLDVHSEKIVFQQPMRNIYSLCRSGKNEIAVADKYDHLRIIDIEKNRLVRELDLTVYRNAAVKTSPVVEVRPAADGHLLYASLFHGFIVIDSEGRATPFSHNLTDPSSLAGDRVVRVLGTPDGTVIVGTERYGLSLFNIRKKTAGYQKVFTDEKGTLFDGYVTEMLQDRDGSIWLGAVDRLIHWNKKTGGTQFYFYPSSNTMPEVYRLCFDKKDRLWVSVLENGVAQFDKKTGRFSALKKDTADKAQGSLIYDLFPSTDGKIWAGGANGFYRFDPETRRTESFWKHPLLKIFCTTRTYGFLEDSKGRIWISTADKGLLCFDERSNTLLQYTKKDGLLDDVCLDMFYSSTGEIYVSHYKGFSVVQPNGNTYSYTTSNGLRFDKADAFVEDNEKNIWVSNAKCLVKFNPITRSMEIFDEKENLNSGGFKPSSVLKTPEGELIWGTQRGVNYFFPQALDNRSVPLNVNIYKVTTADSSYGLTRKATEIPYSKNNVQFDFTAVNLLGAHNIRYQYRLEGYDPQWQEGTDIRQARYSSLAPGAYRFVVRASLNRRDWIASANSFSFVVVAPFYKRWWFYTALLLAFLSAAVFAFFYRSRQLRRKHEELETEQAINYISSSLYRYQSVNEVLWDVARNCIGKLGFEDCVIYLFDESKGLLQQAAAYGPKSPRNFEIEKPLIIPLGQGIVGDVARRRKAEIIGDTSKDSRYIADDAVRYSEIAVPILSGDALLGVLDCENSKKRFFTQKHLSILTTIASLCASKIVTTKTEAEKRETERMLTDTKQKMAEAEMQALRAQMNPHFIFNCLNSINRYIVKSDGATASLYLTRFAKLIRRILDNSNHKNVVLNNELEALKLYVEMESLRFENKFSFEITIDRNVDVDAIEVPPLIIQPYIENAIWHGLLHKESGGHLRLYLTMIGKGLLQCIIEDNGVGRERSAELKSKSATKKSLGMQLTEHRLVLLNQHAAVRSGVEIEDKKDSNGKATGTKVVLKIPVSED